MKRFDHHPVSKLFPMLTEAELNELMADIVAEGVRNPAVLLDGKILDGRNREEACHRAGIPLPTVDFLAIPGVTRLTSPVAWVLSQNLRRRHLNQSQRAMIATEALPLLEAEARKRQGTRPTPEEKGRASAAAAKALRVGTRTVERAKMVAERRPELGERIRSGTLTLGRAERIVRTGSELAHEQVYFIEAIGPGFIKIGRAAFPDRRLSEFQIGCPLELRLLASTGAVEFEGARPWARGSETAIHERFATAKHRGEWFRPVPELLKLIEEIKRGQDD